MQKHSDLIEIVPMNENDIKVVFDIENENFGTKTMDTISSAFSSENLFYNLLKLDDEIIGFYECQIIAPEAELFDIVVTKECRGNGYSKILLEHFIEFAKDKKCSTIFLEVNIMNNKAINLYKKYGFVEYSRRKNYYGNNDAILMKLSL